MIEDIREISISKQAEDILKITGQNEVIQSFVRSDVSNEPDEHRESHKQFANVKKLSTSSWKGINESVAKKLTVIEKPKDNREDTIAKSVARFSYHQLGKDAQDTPQIIRKKSVKYNKRHRLFEEIYTDKDRAAAVNLGTRDIKQSLKLKRKQDRTRILEISEEAHPGTLLTLATHRFKTGDTYVALKFVEKALELNPYDKNALVARSKCYLIIGNAELALKDAEMALVEDKCFIKGLYQKAEALYHLAKFEYSLMYFHKGLHIRPQMETFKEGVRKAQQAIINTIGHCVPSFDKFYPRNSSVNDKDKQIDLDQNIVMTDDKFRTSNDVKLRKELHTDKIYLEKLLYNPDLTQMVINGTVLENKIVTEAKDCIKFLENRQHFWRQQQAITRKETYKIVQKQLKKA